MVTNPSEAANLTATSGWLWAFITLSGTLVAAGGAVWAAYLTRTTRKENRSDHANVSDTLSTLVQQVNHVAGGLDNLTDQNQAQHESLTDKLDEVRVDLAVHLQHHQENEHIWTGTEDRRDGQERRQRDEGHWDPDRRKHQRRSAD